MNEQERQQAAMTFQQGLEQIGAMLRDAAPVVATYYVRLVEGGVPKQIAAMLTEDMQAGLLGLMLHRSE